MPPRTPAKTTPPKPATKTSRAARDLEDAEDSVIDAEDLDEVEDYDTLSAREAGPSLEEMMGKVPALSSADRAKVSSFQRKQRDDDEEETAPLPPKIRSTPYGKAMTANRIKSLDPQTESMCVSIANNGTTLAVGTRNGKLLVLNSKTMELMDTFDVGGGSASSTADLSDLPSAVTAAHFRPQSLGGTMQNVLLLAAGPRVVTLHTSTGRVLAQAVEAGNSINALAVRKDGGSFVTAGSDKALRLYDGATCKLTAKMEFGDDKSTGGHSSRVYGVVYKPDDENVILSGGWDRTVQVWDLRAGHSVSSIFGPYICGDAVDVRGFKVLTGSWRHNNPLQLWDLRNNKLLTNLPFYQPEPDACLIYCAKFLNGSEGIVAGGSGKRACVKTYLPSGELQGTMSTTTAVHSLDSTGGPQPTVAVCCASHLQMMVLP